MLPPIESVELGLPDEAALTELVQRQRWFGARSRTARWGRIVDAAALRPERLVGVPTGVWVLFEIEFADGGSELYQLLLHGRPASESGLPATLDDATLGPELVREVVRAMCAARSLRSADGIVSFHAGELPPDLESEPIRAIGVEQSNSSAVFGERAILKVYRRLEDGMSPELELLRFLRTRGFANAPRLLGWYEYAGPRVESTLGVLQEFVRGEDGWDFALDSLAGDLGRFLESARRLGEVTGTMHTVLASDGDDPHFRPERLDAKALAELGSVVETEARDVFSLLPDEIAGLDPIRGRGDEVLDRLRTLRRLGAFGVVIRHHGDYHLGQVLWTGADWLVLDFEGEPARTLPGRRRKRSPFRDVAGMLRSFAYAAETSRTRSVALPPEWENDVRAAFLGGYLAAVDPTLLPPSDDVREALLAAFELEKAVYELRYELDHRPTWIGVPVAGIVRALDRPVWR